MILVSTGFRSWAPAKFGKRNSAVAVEHYALSFKQLPLKVVVSAFGS